MPPERVRYSKAPLPYVKSTQTHRAALQDIRARVNVRKERENDPEKALQRCGANLETRGNPPVEVLPGQVEPRFWVPIADTPEPPNGDETKAFTAKMEILYTECHTGFNVSVTRKRPMMILKDSEGRLIDNQPRLTITVPKEEMLAPLFRRLLPEYGLAIEPDEDALCFRLSDHSVVKDVSVWDARERAREAHAERFDPHSEHCVIAFLRAPRPIPTSHNCHYAATSQLKGKTVKEILWFEWAPSGYYCSLLGRNSKFGNLALRFDNGNVKVEDIMHQFAHLNGYNIAYGRKALQYELMNGKKIKNPRLMDIVKDWEENHVKIWADEVDATYSLTVYVTRQ